jgi:2,4-didehydro-3-deoxy-L-rhamnonate hydrolase
MKLIRFGAPSQEKPGVILPDGSRRDVSALVRDYDESFWASGQLTTLRQQVAEWASELPMVDPSVRLGPPCARPSKLVCIGLNYADHARESGLEPPREPVIFFKATSAIVGPYDPVKLPPGSEKTDWEVELAVLIARQASHVSVAEAASYIGGYLLHNDYSERHYQIERGGQWVKGKSCDTFAPLGPWLVTPEEIAHPGDLRLWLEVNGERRQDSSTREFIFSVPQVISYLSQFMTLLPGDVISTGTPPGVGLGMNPPTYLRAGDVVRLGIEGLGEAQQQVIA